ncbi:unnamed protein product [Schistosoma guineensis]|nr:unnamed protein product [Schistosoma guineensis]
MKIHSFTLCVHQSTLTSSSYSKESLSLIDMDPCLLNGSFCWTIYSSYSVGPSEHIRLSVESEEYYKLF